MHDYLTFVICAPMGAFGLYAGHERRGSGSFPPRSAVLGLLGAALGIERMDEEGQASLRSYRVASLALSESQPMRDYHTVQTVPAKIKRPGSRRTGIDAIGRDIKTTITFRDYRTDIAIAIAVWGKEAFAWPLPELAAALREPAFVLYVGRKSCPLAAPLNPTLVPASSPVSALGATPVPDWVDATRHGTIVSDPFEGGSPDWVEVAPVDPIDRTTWHFSQGDIWHFDRHVDA